MNKLTKIFYILTVALMVPNAAIADDVQILAADFKSSGNNNWTVSVTLKHKDTGWDHYADNWRIVDNDGRVLGNRILMHPHVNEQPFTRSLGNVVIPENITKVYVEAHDKMHGWTTKRLAVSLGKARSGHVHVEAK